MALNRKLILQRAAAAREAASVESLDAMANGEEPKAVKAPSARKAVARSRKNPGFSPGLMDELQLWAPLSLLGIPVTVSDPSYRVINVPSGTGCIALGAPRSAWKGKELLLDVRVKYDGEVVDGWIRAAHARVPQVAKQAKQEEEHEVMQESAG
jgi:hypothetical protein